MQTPPLRLPLPRNTLFFLKALKISFSCTLSFFLNFLCNVFLDDKKRLHAAAWIAEKALSVATGAAVCAAFALPPGTHAIDVALGVCVPLHAHAGLSQVITDYLPKRKFALANAASVTAVWLFTVASLCGVYHFNVHDIGVTRAIVAYWNGAGEAEKQEAFANAQK